MKDVIFNSIILLAIIFNIGWARSCDQQAAQACTTELQNILADNGADTDPLREHCDMRDSLIESVQECFESHLSACDDEVRNLFTLQMVRARQEFEKQCAAHDNMQDSPGSECDQQTARACVTQLNSDANNLGQDLEKTSQFCATKDALISSTETCISNALQACDENISQMIEEARQFLNSICGTNGNLTDSARCVHEFITKCASAIPQLMRINELFSAKQQGADSLDQDQICSKMQQIDYAELKKCALDLGCVDVDYYESIESVMKSSLSVNMAGSTPMLSLNTDAVPRITIIDLWVGICEPECNKFQENFGAAQNCASSAGSAELDCMKYKVQFDCVRDVIGDCHVLQDFMQMMMDQSSELGKIKSQCNGLDLDLSAVKQGGGAAAVVSGPVLLLIPALVALYRQLHYL